MQIIYFSYLFIALVSILNYFRCQSRLVDNGCVWCKVIIGIICIYLRCKMSTELVNGAESEQLSSGCGDTEVLVAEKPVLHGEQFDVVVKEENDESGPSESHVGDTSHRSGSDVSNESYKSELLKSHEGSTDVVKEEHVESEPPEGHVKEADVKSETTESRVSQENDETDPPESHVGDTSHQSGSDVPSGNYKSELLESNEENTDVVSEEKVESDPPESHVGVASHLMPAAETAEPLVYFDVVKEDYSESKLPESVVGDDGVYQSGTHFAEENHKSVSELPKSYEGDTDGEQCNIVKEGNAKSKMPVEDTAHEFTSHLASATETDTSSTKNLDLNKSLGMVHMTLHFWQWL